MRLRYITLFIVSMLLFSCHKDEENNNLVGTAQWEDTAPVSSQKGNTAIQLQGNPGTQWYAHITEGEEWCSFALSSATSDKEGTLIDGITVLYVYFTENTGEEARNARISIKIGNGETTTLTLTQDGQKKSPGTEPGKAGSQRGSRTGPEGSAPWLRSDASWHGGLSSFFWIYRYISRQSRSPLSIARTISSAVARLVASGML